MSPKTQPAQPRSTSLALEIQKHLGLDLGQNIAQLECIIERHLAPAPAVTKQGFAACPACGGSGFGTGNSDLVCEACDGGGLSGEEIVSAHPIPQAAPTADDAVGVALRISGFYGCATGEEVQKAAQLIQSYGDQRALEASAPEMTTAYMKVLDELMGLETKVIELAFPSDTEQHEVSEALAQLASAHLAAAPGVEVLFDGSTWPSHIKFEDLDWSKAWVDQGPSPAGNAGPYLKVPYPAQETVHRIYFVRATAPAQPDTLIREVLVAAEAALVINEPERTAHVLAMIKTALAAAPGKRGE